MTGRIAIALAVVLALGACSEKPQVAGQRNGGDVRASDGPSTPYTAGKWKAGDHGAWETQLRTRSQGQDDYSRAPS